MRHRWFVGSLERVTSSDLQLTPVDLAIAGYIQHIEGRAAKAAIGRLARRDRDDRIDPADGIQYLDAHIGRDVYAPFPVAFQSVGPRILLIVRYVQPTESLFIGQRPIRQDGVHPDPVTGR